jgi:hypothetical protein
VGRERAWIVRLIGTAITFRKSDLKTRHKKPEGHWKYPHKSLKSLLFCLHRATGLQICRSTRRPNLSPARVHGLQNRVLISTVLTVLSVVKQRVRARQAGDQRSPLESTEPLRKLKLRLPLGARLL